MNEFEKKRRHGRRSLPDNEKRSHVYCLGFNDAEFALLMDRLGVSDLDGRSSRSLGRLIARHARHAALTRESIPVPEINRAAWIELSRAAAALNQLARHLNGGGALLIDHLADDLADFRRSLIGARLAGDDVEVDDLVASDVEVD